jgi:hypothetical protein
MISTKVESSTTSHYIKYTLCDVNSVYQTDNGKEQWKDI